jgi:hypothetical protein
LVNCPAPLPDAGLPAVHVAALHPKPRLWPFDVSQPVPEVHLPSHPTKVALVMLPWVSLCSCHLWMRWFVTSEM